MKQVNLKKYKKSGVDWLGDIPVEWDVRKGKFLFKNQKELNEKFQCDNVLSLTMNGVLHREELGEGGLLPASYDTFQIFYPNNLAFKLIDLENYKTSRVGLVSEKGIMSSAYIRLVINDEKVTNPKFFYYFYYLLYLQGIYNFLGMGVRSTLKPWDLLEISILIPPFEAQKRIADFLDEKTKIIDELIEKKERLVELLREKRASLITRAVTKGLDPKAKMKPSGVDWLGDIPEGWGVEKIKFLADLYTGDSISDDKKSDFSVAFEGIPYISSKDINLDNNVINYETGIYIPKINKNFKIAPKESVLLCIEGGSAGRKIGFTNQDVAFVNKLCCIRSQKQNNRFIYYFLSSKNFQDFFDLNISGLIGGVSIYKLKNFYYPKPSLIEQNQIVSYLNSETAKIDKAVELIESQIEKLKEYRSSLIYHAVTGKIQLLL